MVQILGDVVSDPCSGWAARIPTRKGLYFRLYVYVWKSKS